MERQDGAFLLTANCADIKVCFVTRRDRVRVGPPSTRNLAEESYVLATTAWETDWTPLLRGSAPACSLSSPPWPTRKDSVTFTTAKLRLVVDKDPLSFKLYNGEGRASLHDLPGNPFVLDSKHAWSTTAAWRRTTASTASAKRPAC